MINILEKSVETIKGVGKKYLQTLNELDIYTIRDVLYNIPYRVSSSTDFSISVKDNEKVVATGKVETRVSTQFYGNRRSRSFFSLSTPTGSIKIVFFNQHYLKKNLLEGRDIVVKGIYNKANNTITASSISFGKEEKVVPEPAKAGAAIRPVSKNRNACRALFCQWLTKLRKLRNSLRFCMTFPL